MACFLMTSTNMSRSNANHFQIFTENRGATHCRPIVRRPERFEFLAEARATLYVEGRKRLIDGSVVEAKELHYLRWRKGIAEPVVTSDQLELRQFLAEPFPDSGFVAPQNRRRHS